MSKKKEVKDDFDPNGWLATYADTITLLMTFFVLLYSMSTLDAVKFKSVSSSLSGVLSGKKSSSILEWNMNNGDVPVVGKIVPSKKTNSKRSPREIVDNLTKILEDNNLKDKVAIKDDSRGLMLEIKDKILFESGKADLKSNSIEVLNVLAEYIKEIPNDILIEGHTDNIPISNYKYKDNWDLSAARASSVTRYFTSIKGMDSTRFYAMFLGEYHPVADNNNNENRAMNRRVNILILNDSSNEKVGDK